MPVPPTESDEPNEPSRFRADALHTPTEAHSDFAPREDPEYYKLFPGELTAERAAHEVKKAFASAGLQRPTSLAGLSSRSPHFVSTVRAAQTDRPQRHVLDFGRGATDLLIGELASAPIWVVSLPDVSDDLIANLAADARLGGCLCEWPTLWNKNLQFDIGVTDFPIRVHLYDYTNDASYLENDSVALIIAYANTSTVAFAVHDYATDQGVAFYLSNYRGIRDYSLLELQTSARQAKSSLASGTWPNDPGLLHMYPVAPPDKDGQRLPAFGLPLLGGKVLLEAVELKQGVLSELCAFASDLPEVGEQQVLRLLCRSGPYQFLSRQVTSRALHVYCTSGVPWGLVLVVRGDAESFVAFKQLSTAGSHGVVEASSFLSLPIVIEHRFDGRLAKLAPLHDEDVMLHEVEDMNIEAWTAASARLFLEKHGASLPGMGPEAFAGHLVHGGDWQTSAVD